MTNKSTSNKKFLFSVVIPIYNCEEYLPDAMESLVNQTIGFEDNIQVILVNDGSTDNSKNVCLEYCAKYPDNVSYHEQPNSGVSAARNLGMKYVQGEYVNFLDADDKWQDDVFEKAERMFHKHPEIDVIGVRVHYFEASEAYHPLDYKFNRDKVVDIFNEYDHIQMAVTSAFFRANSISHCAFDTSLKYAEDSKFVLEVLLKRGKLGIISTSEHLYRKRLTDSSAIQTKSASIDWYTTTITNYHKWAIKKSLSTYGFVIPYIQYSIMYEYQWRAKERIPDSIPKSVVDQYLKQAKSTLSYIDDHIILEQKKLTSEYKIEFLKLKYGLDDIFEQLAYKKHGLYFHNLLVVNLRNIHTIKINTLDEQGKNLIIAGMVNCPIPQSDYCLYCTINGRDAPINLSKTEVYTRHFFNRPFISNYGFKIETDIRKLKSISFKLIYKNLYQTNMPFSDGPQSKIGMNKGLYCTGHNRIIYCRKRKIICTKRTPKSILRVYTNCVLWLKAEKRSDMQWARFSTIIRRRILRKMNRQIWLFSDRPDAANDNGAALFEYINNQKIKNIIPIFIISKESPDYKRMQKIGKVVGYGTKKHKRLFLLADKNISSQADEWVVNPYGNDGKYIKDLYRSDFIFLQHGVIQNDLSSWISIYTKNIAGFCCTTLPEHESITSDTKYGFDAKNIWLTGLARYDRLTSHPSGKIILAPTWRLSVAAPIDIHTGKRLYSTKFKGSSFFSFYNRLINDNNILKLLKKHNYKINFLLHPAFAANACDFKYDKKFVDIIANADYNQYFNEGNILITDYSSTVFDFAYLHKPVIYTQFDRNEFFTQHTYKMGYFSYEKDGFGPVCYDYESSVKEICRQIESGCKMSDKYKKRVDNTFAFHDKNNCKRILDAILNGGTK